MTTLEYYYIDGSHAVFNKYTIDTIGIIKNNKSGKYLSYALVNGYYVASVRDNGGKQTMIYVARAVASTFLGKPPTLQHTVDHIINDQKLNNDVSNIRWACKNKQAINRKMPDTNKSAFIIVKDNLEMTSKEWKEHLRNTYNQNGKKYTAGMVSLYAIRKKHGFSYKEYPDLEDEVWKCVKDSETPRGDYWEISNKSRVKFITKHTSNVLSGEHLGLWSGYPCITINGKIKLCHILAFEAFYPDVPRGALLVLHKHDDRNDFCPENLRLGTASENGKDAHNNGRFDGAKSTRAKCASYINGILEKEHDSQMAAAEYLRANGHKKANQSAISKALTSEYKLVYKRTWKLLI